MFFTDGYALSDGKKYKQEHFCKQHIRENEVFNKIPFKKMTAVNLKLLMARHKMQLLQALHGHKFAFVDFLRTVTFDGSAVIGHHMSVPSILVTFLYCHEVLVESLSLFVTDGSKVFWEFVQVTEQKMDFDAPKSFPKSRNAKSISDTRMS